jgi:hypothetical protein
MAAILILPPFTSSSRIGFRSAYLIPVAALNLLRSILPPLLARIQRIRSRGDCERLVISGWLLIMLYRRAEGWVLLGGWFYLSLRFEQRGGEVNEVIFRCPFAKT